MAQIALVIGALAAIVYPIPLQLQGTTYYQTVGFLVLVNAMLGVGWNVIGGWAGQFPRCSSPSAPTRPRCFT
jgi:ABC-type branched-subunit amino acid transport system permease subunit